jgi:hypothetical protein
MTVTLSSAAYLVEGVIRVPPFLSLGCAHHLPVAVQGCRHPLISWSWVCVSIFFGRLVPAVDPDSRMS